MLSTSPAQRSAFRCEACGAKLIKRTSFRMHQHLRHDVWRCENDACAACYVGNSEVTSIATPSGDPECAPSSLPPTKAYMRLLVRLAQLESAPPPVQVNFVADQEREAMAEKAANGMREEGIGVGAIDEAIANCRRTATAAGEDDDGEGQDLDAVPEGSAP